MVGRFTAVWALVVLCFASSWISTSWILRQIVVLQPLWDVGCPPVNNNDANRTKSSFTTASTKQQVREVQSINDEDQRTTSKGKPTDPCRGYDGVLRIRSGDTGAAAGAVFYKYMINHIIYAERNNLLPWIHLDNTSHRIYDVDAHGGGRAEFQMLAGRIRGDKNGVPYDDVDPVTQAQLEYGRGLESYEVEGNGVWPVYFEPLSDFDPFQNRTCWTNKPLYEFHYNQIVLGLHGSIDWGVRAWAYGVISPKEKLMRLRDWYRPMRRRGARVVRQYIKPRKWLQLAADKVNPLEVGQECLAMHVRTTDKDRSGGRLEVPLKNYLPHAIRFLRKHGENSVIFLATDSSKTLDTIRKDWPVEVSSRVRSQGSIIRSSSLSPTFDLASHHRINTEVLTDIYAMAKCSMMLHGRSAVSEAVLYINPDMREFSMDLEDDSVLLKDIP